MYIPDAYSGSIICVLVIVICVYALDVKILYPKFVIDAFAEPLGRFLAYLAVYVASMYNIQIALLLLIIVVNIHMDVINLLGR